MINNNLGNREEEKKNINNGIIKTNKSLVWSVKIATRVSGEALKSSMEKKRSEMLGGREGRGEEGNKSRQNKLEAVKLSGRRSRYVVLIFVYRSIYRCVKFTRCLG